MRTIDELRSGVQGWLIDHELNDDTAFYTPDEWRTRDESLLANSNLILVFEGELYRVVNGCHEDCMKLREEFEHFVGSFGYFLEFGHAWSMGFYPYLARRPHVGLRIFAE